MPTVSVNLDTTQYVQVNTSLNPLILQAHRDAVRITLSDSKPTKGNSVFHLLGGDDNPLPFDSIDTNVWALAVSDRSSLVVSETTAVPTNQSNGVPNTFTNITTNTSRTNISKGQLNKIGIQPRIGNEHVESSREIQGVVSNGNIVGQIFRASKDNITALMFTLESAQGIVIDDFESYADNAALQAVWSASSALATLETVIVHGGVKAMSLPTTNTGDEWERSSAPQDFTDFTGTFNAYFSHSFAQQQIAVYIEDSIGNNKSFTIIQDGPGSWCDCAVNEKAMTENPGNSADTDITDITRIGFRVILKRTGGSVIIDDLASVPPPGDIEIKLWDMGDTKPISATTSIDDGTQYQQIGGAQAASYTLSLEGGKRLYHIEEFTAGANKSIPTNELLTINNYYIFELKWIDTDVSVYGPDTSFNTDYYNSGFAFTAPDEATVITAIGQYSDLMFGILSTQPAYIVKAAWRFNAAPNGGSSISVFIESDEMKVSDVVVDHEHSPEQEFTSDLSIRPQYLADGGKLEYYYNDDFTYFYYIQPNN